MLFIQLTSRRGILLLKVFSWGGGARRRRIVLAVGARGDLQGRGEGIPGAIQFWAVSKSLRQSLWRPLIQQELVAGSSDSCRIAGKRLSEALRNSSKLRRHPGTLPPSPLYKSPEPHRQDRFSSAGRWVVMKGKRTGEKDRGKEQGKKGREKGRGKTGAGRREKKNWAGGGVDGGNGFQMHSRTMTCSPNGCLFAVGTGSRSGCRGEAAGVFAGDDAEVDATAVVFSFETVDEEAHEAALP